MERERETHPEEANIQARGRQRGRGREIRIGSVAISQLLTRVA